jgi:hypothetical protein
MLLVMVVKRRNSIGQLLALALLLGCLVLIQRNTKIGLLMMGGLAILAAFWVEYHSARIWKEYKRNYHPSRNNLVTKLTQPREIYHILNVYALWPLIFALGVWAVYSASKL